MRENLEEHFLSISKFPESLSVTSVQVDAGPSCDNHVITRGGCLHLMCTSTPRSSITWSRVDNQPIVYVCIGVT